MFAESIAQAFCIATDATGAPVRAPGGCEKWHIFVFIADRDHVVFRYSEEHTSEAMQKMLGGYHGHLLSDAAAIYDILHREGAIESACWFHLRRYFWRGLPTDQERALEILSLIAKLFEVDRECRSLALPEKTEQRAARSQPVLDVIDEWVNRNRKLVDPRGPLDKGIGYYLNQREALHRFRDDGRLRLDNSISEQQLRNAVLGRHNWMYFANETGLKWYTTFRSLIASCVVHDIQAHEYLEQVMRLAPHWPVSRVLELSPKYWEKTVAELDEEHRATLTPPWCREWPAVNATAPPEEEEEEAA
ncbi:transposase [Myxococcota bacterium]